MGYIIAVDQGTTSTRSIVFDDQFAIVGQGQEEFEQHFPKSGWVEHNPQDLLTTVIKTCKKALNDGKIRAKDILALGITNCLLYTSPSPRDRQKSRMPSSA